MQNDEVLQATLLLSCYFNKSEVKRIKPLTPTEYARFAAWLHQQKLTPADLLRDQSAVSEKWQDPKGKITADRIKSLFARGASMGFALEQWAKHGVWVVSRPNVDYPRKLKERLGDTRPPIFFGVGNQALLNKPGIGFVGSRTIDASDESFAQTKAEFAVSQGFMVISGGAKGIDQTAMRAALDCGGESVGIIAESLLKASTAKTYREGLRENRLALISPFYPEAGFNIGNAMARNKYIYVMSEAVVVVKSGFNNGGTWTGAKENLSKRWVPLLVRNAAFDGNQELIKLGGVAIDESFDDFDQPPIQAISSQEQSEHTSNGTEPARTGDLFESLVRKANSTEAPDSEISNDPQKKKKVKLTISEDQSKKQIGQGEAEYGETVQASLFDDYGKIFSLFYRSLLEIGRNGKEIKATLLLELYPELTKVFVEKWLKLLASEGYLKKDGRNLVYKITDKATL